MFAVLLVYIYTPNCRNVAVEHTKYQIGINYLNVWFQKISIPPPRRELEIPEGWEGGAKAQEIPEGWGVDGQIEFQMVQFDSTNSCSCKKTATYQL